MNVARVAASIHRVEVRVPLVDKPRLVTVVVVEVETDAGLVGYGVAGPQHAWSVVELINREIAPFLVRRDVLLAEGLAHALEQRFNPRAMTGVVSSALSGIDIALWDVRGKVLGQPVWRLLGGYSPEVEVYVTFGLPEYDIDQLVQAARLAVSRGYSRLKMVVGLASDIARITRVRDAVGADVRLMIDANEAFDVLTATELARHLTDLDITWFEEPLAGNDVRSLAELRSRIDIPVSAGQFEGHRFRLRDLMLGSAVDIVQTNVLYVGGYTAGKAVADVAEALRLPIAVGGGWGEHNAPLMAAVANNRGVEMHAWQWTLVDTLYAQAPEIRSGVMTLSERPGVGLEPRAEVLRDTRTIHGE